MKHINNETYQRIKRALIDYVDNRKDCYDYLNKLINEKENLLSKHYIKKAWDDKDEYKNLIGLAIIVHYDNCIVEMGQNGFTMLSNSSNRMDLAQKIKLSLKEYSEVA